MADYIDDLELTKQLIKEKEEFQQGKIKKPSENLAKKFLLVLNKVLTSSKYSGYTLDWKNDFKSKAHELFVKHWYKFNPERIQKNFYQKDNKKILKKEEDYKGAHGWFTLLITTAIHDEIKRHKKYNNFVNELAEEKTKEIWDVGQHLFTK